MAKIGLSFYSVKVTAPINGKYKNKYEDVPLDKLNKRTIADWVYDFLHDKMEKYQKDSEKEKIYRPHYLETSDYMVKGDNYFSSVCGIIKSGDYGVEVEIVDSDTSKKVFDQKKEQAGILPFGFALYFSEGISTGILVTQSYGVKGMTNHFKQIITQAVEENCSKHKVIIKNIFPNTYFKRLLDNGKIKDICVETYRKPKMEDKDDAIKNKEIIDYSTREIKYKNPIFKDKNNIYNIFIQRQSLNEIRGLTSDDEEIKNLKVDFVVNGTLKTVNYDTYFSLRISEDITDKVTINPDTGHPLSLSLFEQMDNYVTMYLRNMNIVSELNENEEYVKKWKRHCHIKVGNDGKEEVVNKDNENIIVTV